jgi:hypothetical protein
MRPTQPDTDYIHAHLNLLRAIDRLLAEAEAVRDRRAALDRLLARTLAPQVALRPASQEKVRRA